MKVRAIIVFVVLLVLSCNQVNLDPVDPGEVPTAALGVVRGRFPNAKNLVFKPIVSSKIWEVDFISGTDSYNSLVDQTKMWETFKATIDASTGILGNAILNRFIGGGSLSDNSEDIDFYPATQYQKRNRMMYRFAGLDYVVDWKRWKNTTIYQPTYANFEQLKYKIQFTTPENFPKEITDYLATKNLAFAYGEIRIKLNYEKQYYVMGGFNSNGKDLYGFLLFDEKGVLKWTSRELNKAYPNDEYTIETLPGPIQQFLDNSPELANFQYATPEADRWHTEYEGVSSYYLKLSRNGYNETCELYFDQEGNLLYKRYFLGF